MDELVKKQEVLDIVLLDPGIANFQLKMIQNLPPAQKHGRWVKAVGDWCTPGGDPVWECSECGKGRHVYGVEASTYQHDIADGQWVSCPNCGARMKG